jgi:hypothetical protein
MGGSPGQRPDVAMVNSAFGRTPLSLFEIGLDLAEMKLH